LNPTEFHNLAISGNTSFDILARIESETVSRLRDKPKNEWTMILGLGTNDARIKNGKPGCTPEQYKENVEKLLDIAQKHVGRVIFLGGKPVIEELTVPFDSGSTFYNEDIKRNGGIAKEICEARGVEFINKKDPHGSIFYLFTKVPSNLPQNQLSPPNQSTLSLSYYLL